MKKKPLVLMIIAGCLALALAVSGIVSAAVISSRTTVRYEEDDLVLVNGLEIDGQPSEGSESQIGSESSWGGDSSGSALSSGSSGGKPGQNVNSDSTGRPVALVEGSVRPQSMASGGYYIPGQNTRLEIYSAKSEYKTRVMDAKGKVMAEQVNPINIQIKKPNPQGDYLGNRAQTEMFAGNYSRLTVKGNTVVAYAELKSKAGSVFVVTDQYIGSKTGGGFELARDIQVKKSADGDEGFNSIVKFKEPGTNTHDKYEYFIPGIIMRNSTNMLVNSIGYNMGLNHVWVRDTHMGLPMVMLRNKETGRAFSLGRVVDKKVYTGIDENQGNWVISKNLDYGSVGISNTEKYSSADVCYPGIEGQVNYVDRNLEMVRRSHPVRDDVVHSYRVAFRAEQSGSFTDSMTAAYQAHFNLCTVPDVKADLNKVYDVTLNLFSEFTQEYSPGKMGMPFAFDMDGDIAALDYLIGFVGQQTSVGFHLIRSGIQNKSALQRQKGGAIIDFWVRDGFTRFGFPRVWFGTSANAWAENSFVPSFMRYMADGMEGMLDAYLEEKSAGTVKSEWMEKCVTFADWLVSRQNNDGSYYRAYDNTTGEVYAVQDMKNASSKSNTAHPIRYLVRMYEQTGKAAYLNAARRAGEYAYSEYYQKGNYHGGTADGYNLQDKEGAVLALYAFNALYEQTRDKKWLAAAENAAVCAAGFVFTYDFNVWGKEKFNIYRDKVGTSGLSIIGTGGINTDTFSAYLYYEFFKMYVHTGKDFYYKFALLLQNNTKQFINIGGSLQYGREGLINEAQSISNQFYAQSVDACLVWCNISMITPIAEMEDTFGVNSIEQANKLGAERLREMMKVYGSGGKKR